MLRSLIFICLISFQSISQESESRMVINQIETCLTSGYLNKALNLVSKLTKLNPDTESDSYKMSVLYNARITGLMGDNRGMIGLLNTIDPNNESLIIKYYWQDYFSRYCLQNEKFKLGINSLQKSIETAGKIEGNLRITIRKNISELFLIYYTEGIERKLEQNQPLPERVSEILNFLKQNEPRMVLSEKHYYYSYQLFFTNPGDTATRKVVAKKNIDFGKKNNQPISAIIGLINYSNCVISSDTTQAEKYLLEAEVISQSIQHLLHKLIIRYELMIHYKRRGQFQKAISWGKKAIFPDGTDFSNYLDVYGQLSECYEEIGQIDSALLLKKIDNEKFRSISRAHDDEMQEFYINQQNTRIEEKKRVIEKNKWFIGLLISTTLVILALWYKNKKMNKAIRSKNESLELSLNTLQSFSHILSHDLRAPIHSIRNLCTHILEDNVELSKDNIESLELIRECSNNSIVLITNIMTYIQSKNIEVSIEQFDFAEIIQDVQNNLFDLINYNDAEIIHENVPKSIVGNKILFIQLFQNLIQNAIKYKKETEAPVIRVSFNPNGKTSEINVSDNGIGIKPCHLCDLLEAFKQKEFVSIDQGIGLGLSISLNIVNIHKGQMKLSSEQGKGTTVHLTFPSQTFC